MAYCLLAEVVLANAAVSCVQRLDPVRGLVPHRGGWTQSSRDLVLPQAVAPPAGLSYEHCAAHHSDGRRVVVTGPESSDSLRDYVHGPYD